MDRVNLLEMLSQADNETGRGVFEDFMRGAVRYALVGAMAEEVENLCGPRYGRSDRQDCVRAGSAPGVAFFDTDSETIRRPRVRRTDKDGRTSEVSLATYEAGRKGDGLREAILRGFTAGVSSRKTSTVLPSNRRTSKSDVARVWEGKAGEYVERVRGRSLETHAYIALMIDGVVLSKEVTAVVALGITDKGEKQMLDFEIGASESAATCTALTDRLVERGFRLAARRPLVVLDGSKALRKAVCKHWPTAAIQTCLIHVARILRGKLARRWRGEMEGFFKRLREASSLEAAEEALVDLERFVARHSAEGRKTLEIAREEMLTLFRLGVPDTFNKPLLSTNSIENSFRNMRRLLGRVTRWRAETDMGSRWVSCAMLEAEKGFRRIQGYRDIPLLIQALNRDPMEEEQQINRAA